MKREGQVPVLLVLDTWYFYGQHKAYLHDKALSAFPGEQEYLLGFGEWKVTAIKPKVLKEHKSNKLEVTVMRVYIVGWE